MRYCWGNDYFKYLTVTDIELKFQEIIVENDKRDKLSKLLLSTPTIKKTAQIANFKNFKTNKTLKIFKKSKGLMFGGFLLVGMILFAIVMSILRNGEQNFGGLATGFFLLFVLTYSTLKQFFFDESLNFTIYIDNEGIQIDETLFIWQRVRETAILNLPGRNDGTNILVILLYDDSYWTYNLSNFYTFNGIAKSLSNYIEFFKNKDS